MAARQPSRRDLRAEWRGWPHATWMIDTIVPCRLSAGIIGQAVPVTVKDNVVAVGKDTLDLAASIRMIRHDPGNKLLHAFHAVFDQRIVLAIGGNSVKPEGIFDPAFEQGLIVEGDDD